MHIVRYNRLSSHNERKFDDNKYLYFPSMVLSNALTHIPYKEQHHQDFLLEQKICNHVYEYAYDNMCLSKEYGLFCHGAWVNRNDRGDCTPLHHHSNSLISGVYYIEVDASEQGAIQFDDEKGGPFGKFFTVLKYSELNQRNTHRATIECKNGMIILFPSVLKHSVAKNISNTSRYSLAFDYMLSGEFDAMVNRMIYYK